VSPWRLFNTGKAAASIISVFRTQENLFRQAFPAKRTSISPFRRTPENAIENRFTLKTIICDGSFFLKTEIKSFSAGRQKAGIHWIREAIHGTKQAGESTVLLVEDNPLDEELTIRALRRSRLANPVLVARDGAEALKYCRAGRERRCPGGPLDLNLPKFSGLEVLRQIRDDARTRLLPVVILTSSRADEDRLASYELGCNSFVRKPVEFKQFAEAVGQLAATGCCSTSHPA
jgi:two-component system response regulator